MSLAAKARSLLSDNVAQRPAQRVVTRGGEGPPYH
jgi:hypothetical protein